MTDAAPVPNRKERRVQTKKEGRNKIPESHVLRHRRINRQRQARENSDIYLERQKRHKEAAVGDIGLAKRLEYWKADNVDTTVVVPIVVLLMVAYVIGAALGW